MKILLISDALCTGGAETFVLRLARKLRQLGHDCVVLNLNADFEDERLLNQYKELVIKRIRIPQIKWIKRADKALRLLKIDFSIQHQATRFIFQRHYSHGYDVYHSHLFPADYLIVKANVPGAAMVTTFHGDYVHYADQAVAPDILNFMQKVETVLNQLDQLVYISDHQRDELATRFGAYLHKFSKIYNGFELQEPGEPVPPPDPKITTFIMVARGLKEKGWLTAIRAFQRLKGEIRLMLVGEGEYLDSLRSQYPDPRIEYVGYHAAPTDLLRKAHIFIFPSVYKAESLPTVIVEALSCGVPVISTDVGEVKRMITASSGKLAGQLIAVGEEEELVTAFAAAMQQHVDNPGLRLEQSYHALDAFKKFDMETCAGAYLAVYQSARLSRSAG